MKILVISKKDGGESIAPVHIPFEETGAENNEIIAIDAEKDVSEEEIELAYHLAKKCQKNGTCIAKKLRYEFLLWLAGKKDIKSTLTWAGISKVRETEMKRAVIVCFEGQVKLPSGWVEDTEHRYKIRKKALPLEIERISLSRL